MGKSIIIGEYEYEIKYDKWHKDPASRNAFRVNMNALKELFKVKKTLIATGITLSYGDGKKGIDEVIKDRWKWVRMLREGRCGSGYLWMNSQIEKYHDSREKGYHIHVVVYTASTKSNVYGIYNQLKWLWGKVVGGGGRV